MDNVTEEGVAKMHLKSSVREPRLKIQIKDHMGRFVKSRPKRDKRKYRTVNLWGCINIRLETKQIERIISFKK